MPSQLLPGPPPRPSSVSHICLSNLANIDAPFCPSFAGDSEAVLLDTITMVTRLLNQILAAHQLGPGNESHDLQLA